MKTYTNEELTAMTAEQLKAAILEMQISANNNNATPAENTVQSSEEDAIRADIEKIKTAIADLKTTGSKLFSEEIANLETKLKNAEAEVTAALQNVGTEIEQEAQTVESGVSAWWISHRDDVYKIVGLALLAYIAIRG